MSNELAAAERAVSQAAAALRSFDRLHGSGVDRAHLSAEAASERARLLEQLTSALGQHEYTGRRTMGRLMATSAPKATKAVPVSKATTGVRAPQQRADRRPHPKAPRSYVLPALPLQRQRSTVRQSSVKPPLPQPSVAKVQGPVTLKTQQSASKVPPSATANVRHRRGPFDPLTSSPLIDMPVVRPGTCLLHGMPVGTCAYCDRRR